MFIHNHTLSDTFTLQGGPCKSVSLSAFWLGHPPFISMTTEASDVFRVMMRRYGNWVYLLIDWVCTGSARLGDIWGDVWHFCRSCIYVTCLFYIVWLLFVHKSVQLPVDVGLYTSWNGSKVFRRLLLHTNFHIFRFVDSLTSTKSLKRSEFWTFNFRKLYR